MSLRKLTLLFTVKFLLSPGTGEGGGAGGAYLISGPKRGGLIREGGLIERGLSIAFMVITLLLSQLVHFVYKIVMKIITFFTKLCIWSFHIKFCCYAEIGKEMYQNV